MSDIALKICYIGFVSCSLTYWGCNGFDGVSRIAGCTPSLSDESRKKASCKYVIDNNYSYRLAA